MMSHCAKLGLDSLSKFTDEAFAKCDANSNGKLTFEEFENFL